MSLVPRTIAGKLVFYIGLTNIVVLTATVWFSYVRVRIILVDQIDARALQQVENAAARVDDFLAKAAVRAEMIASRKQALLRTAASAPATTEPAGEPAPASLDAGLQPLLVQMLKDTPEDEAYGLWFSRPMESWNPKADPHPLLALHRKNWPNPTPFGDDYLAKIPETEEWYLGPKKAGKLYITDPYYDDGGGDVSMVSLGVPSIDLSGRFAGVAGVDLSLDRIRTLITALHCAAQDEVDHGQDDFAFLVSRSGRIIVHPDTKLMLGKGNPGVKIEKLDEGKQIMQQAQGSETIRIKGTDRRLYWATAPLGGWKVVLNVPNTIITSRVHDLALRAGLLALTGVIVSISVLVLIARSISKPLQRLTGIAQLVAQGNLHGARTELDKLDLQPTAGSEATDADRSETVRLFSAICTMTGNLSALIGQVQRSSVQIMSTATQIAAAAKEQEATVTTFGGSTSEIAASVKEITATSQELLNTMNTVSAGANQTTELAASGQTLLQTRQSLMNQLIDATGSISGKLSVISQKAGDINVVITTITKVAEQTNLLSINAAIEAEKAGEYGLGFLVVAREIRRLADQTAVATLDIERMVREMQTSVSSGVMEMDKFSQEVRRSVQEMGGLTGQLGQIIQQVQALTGRFDEVNEGMSSQSQGAEQINEAMIHLTEAARQTAASLTEFNKATQHLNEAVGGLKDQVLRFKVEG